MKYDIFAKNLIMAKGRKKLHFDIDEHTRYDMKTQDLVYEYKTRVLKLGFSKLIAWIPSFVCAVDADIRRYGSKEERAKHEENKLMSAKVQCEYDNLKKIVDSYSSVKLNDEDVISREMKTIEHCICEVVNWTFTFAKVRGMVPKKNKKPLNFTRLLQFVAMFMAFLDFIVELIAIIYKHDDKNIFHQKNIYS